jgi:hypothetical protein
VEEIPITPSSSNSTYDLMCKRYGKFRKTNFPQRLLTMDFNDLMKSEQLIRNEFGFSKQEIMHIVKQKPTLLLYSEEYEKENKGILALKEVMCNQMNVQWTIVKNLIVKYP